MDIALFIIIFVTDMFLVTIFNYVYNSNYQYKSGMYLGVHIPSEHSNDEEVLSLVSSCRRNMKRFNLINAILSIVVSLLIFYDAVIFTFVYCLWLIIYCGGLQYLLITSHRKMYALKISNNWIIESQKRKLYIDTKISADTGKTHVTYWYHILFIIIQTALFIPFIRMRSKSDYEIIFIFYISSVIISAVALAFHIAVGKLQKNIYSTDSALNYKVNTTLKKYVCTALILLSAVNTIAWSYAAIATLVTSTLLSATTFVYTFIEILSAGFLIVPLIMARHKKDELLSADNNIEYIDDDDYWKTGFYYNPNDRRTFVPDRLQSTNYALNYAKKGAWIFTGTTTAIIIACFIFMAVVLLPFINLHIDTEITDNTFTVSAGGYTSKLNISDITDIQLLDELPKDHFTRVNGGSTDTYDVGIYKGDTYGRCRLYIMHGASPVMMIKTDNQLIFMNSPEDGVINNLYEQLRR